MEQMNRLLDTMEANAVANTKLATSVEGLVGEIRTQSEKVAALSTTCAASQKQHERELAQRGKAASVVWSVAKHPSTILLTAFALWLAAQLAVPAENTPAPEPATVEAPAPPQ